MHSFQTIQSLDSFGGFNNNYTDSRMEQPLTMLYHRAQWDRLLVDLTSVSSIVELQKMAESKFVSLPEDFVIIDTDTAQVFTLKHLEEAQAGTRKVHKLRIASGQESTIRLSSIKFEDDEELENINSKLNQMSEQSRMIDLKEFDSSMSFEEIQDNSIKKTGQDKPLNKSNDSFEWAQFSKVEPSAGRKNSDVNKMLDGVYSVLKENKEQQSQPAANFFFDFFAQENFPHITEASKQNKPSEIKSKTEENLINKKKVVVNEDIQCDGCFAFPIEGTIYKCMICPNFDLCESCEAKRTHCHHPALKIKQPGQYPVNLSVTFDGSTRKYFKKQEKRLRKQKKEAAIRAVLEKKEKDQGQVIDASTLKSTKVQSKNFLSSLGWL